MTGRWISLLCFLAPLSALAQDAPKRTATLPAQPFAPPGEVRDLAFCPDAEVLAGATGRGIVLWSASGKRIGVLGTDWVHGLAARGTTLYSVENHPPRICAWDLTGAKLRAERIVGEADTSSGFSSHGPTPPRVCLAPSPDGKRIAVAWKGTVSILDADLKPLRELRRPTFKASPGLSAHADGVDVTDSYYAFQSVFWTEAGSVSAFISGRMGAGGWTWDLALANPTAKALTGQEHHPRWKQDAWVEGAHALPGGARVELRTIRSGDGWSRELVRWNADGGVSWRHTFQFPANGYSCFAVVGERVVLPGGQNVIGGRLPTRVYALATGKEIRAGGPAGLRELYARGARVVVWDRENQLWELHAEDADWPQTKPVRLTSPVHLRQAPIAAFDVDPTLTWAGAGSEDGRFWVWELRTGRMLARWKEQRSSADTGRLWLRTDSSHRTVCHTLVGRTHTARLLDGSVLFTQRDAETSGATDAGGELWQAGDRLLDRISGQDLRFEHDRRFPTAHALSIRGDLAAMGGIRNGKEILYLWRIRRQPKLEAQRLRTIANPTRVQQLAFNPDGSRFAAIDREGLLVGSPAGEDLQRVPLHGAARLAFLDDRRLVVGDLGGRLTYWSLP